MIELDPEIQSLIPPLSDEEYNQLKDNIKKDGLRDPAITWGKVLIDGHHRKRICDEMGIELKTVSMNFDTRIDVLEWVLNNQFGRRNLTTFQKAELALKYEPIIAARAKENLKTSTGGSDPQPLVKKPKAAIHTHEEVAKKAGISATTIQKAKVITDKGNDETKEKLRKGETSIHQEYQKIKQEEKIIAHKTKITEIQSRPVVKTDKKYDVIVIDPPWDAQKIPREVRPNQIALDYPTMTVEEIKNIALPYHANCHLWVWTTHRFLPNAFDIISHWNFKYVCAFVWHKPGGFQPVHLPQYNCEFALYAKIGNPLFVETKNLPVCFNAPRGSHSEKPEVFYETVRRVTAGQRIDMFNRRKIEGFDGWGNESK